MPRNSLCCFVCHTVVHKEATKSASTSGVVLRVCGGVDAPPSVRSSFSSCLVSCFLLGILPPLFVVESFMTGLCYLSTSHLAGSKLSSTIPFPSLIRSAYQTRPFEFKQMFCRCEIRDVEMLLNHVCPYKFILFNKTKNLQSFCFVYRHRFNHILLNHPFLP